MFYSFTGSGDGPSFVRDANWDIIEKTIGLPGGVNLTIKPQEPQANDKKQYSLPSALGHTLLTANAAGTNTSNGNGPLSTFTYDPFGNSVPGSVLPANTEGGSYGFGGPLQKYTETNFELAPIQMGARLYIPGLGRFLQADPIPGGAANAYVYALDPINSNDYSGLCVWALQCTVTVSQLQPAAPVSKIQRAASTQQVHRTYSNAKVVSAPTKAAKKPKAKAKPMPRVAAKDLVDFEELRQQDLRAGRIPAYYDPPTRPGGPGYLNISGGLGVPGGPSIGFGIKIGAGGIHPHMSTGFSIGRPGASGSITVSPSEISRGCDQGVSGFLILGGSRSISGWEVGLGTPDLSVGQECTW